MVSARTNNGQILIILLRVALQEILARTIGQGRVDALERRAGGCSERDWGTSWNGFIQNDVLKMQNISRPIIRHLISCANNSDTICLGASLWIQVLFTNHITIFALLRAHPRTGSIRSRAEADMIYTCPSSLFISCSTTRHPCHLNGVNSSSLHGIISIEMFQGFRSPLPPF